MLIIFDLDDTLVETSKCLTSIRLKESLFSMIDAGLEVGDSEVAFQELLSINDKIISSTVALPEFGKKYGAKKEIIDIGLQTLFAPLSEKIQLFPVPGAIELLKELVVFHKLALVTLGHSILQLQKLEKAGIQPQYFSKIVVGKGKSKKPEYKQILEEFDVMPEAAIVCGDRVPVDLTPAKELGMSTVHFLNGRGLIFKEPKEHIDFSISTLPEIKKILTKSKI